MGNAMNQPHPCRVRADFPLFEVLIEFCEIFSVIGRLHMQLHPMSPHLALCIMCCYVFVWLEGLAVCHGIFWRGDMPIGALRSGLMHMCGIYLIEALTDGPQRPMGHMGHMGPCIHCDMAFRYASQGLGVPSEHLQGVIHL